MTQGNALRHILVFAIPLFIGNMLQQIYSMVDTTVAGYSLGEGAIAAIGATSSLFALFTDFAVGLNSGFGIVLSHKFGAHDDQGFKTACANMMVLNLRISVICTLFFTILIKPILHLMNVPPEIFTDAYIYIIVIIMGIIFTFTYNLFANILRAVGNSSSALYFLLASGIINVGLDILLMKVLKMGVLGAAIATVSATLISAVLCVFYTFKNYKGLLPSYKEFKSGNNLYKELLTTGFAMALMYCVVDFGSIIFQGATNKLGDLYIAAHTAARRIIMLLMQPLIAIATANSTFVGQNYGAGKLHRIRTTIKKIMALEVVIGLVTFIFVYLTDKYLIKFTTGTNNADIIKNGVLSLRIHLPFYAPLGVLFVIRTSLQGMGQKIIPIISSSMELGIKILSAAVMIPQLGFIGTCITEPIIWVICMIFLVISYVSYSKKHLEIGAENSSELLN